MHNPLPRAATTAHSESKPVLSIPETSKVVCKNSASRRRGGVFLFGLCQVAPATDLQGFCETENPDLIQAIADQDGYFVVVFSWTADGVPGDRQLDPVVLHPEVGSARQLLTNTI